VNLASHFQTSSGGARRARDYAPDLGPARADESGKADDLARANIE
jgi:hypothetical protein